MYDVAAQFPYLTVFVTMVVCAAAYCMYSFDRAKDIARMERGLWNQRHYEVRPHPEVSFSSDGKYAITLYPDPNIQRTTTAHPQHPQRSFLRRELDDSILLPFWSHHVAGTPTQLFAFKLGMTCVLLMPFLLGAAVGFLCLTTTTRASSSERKSRRIRRRKMIRTVDATALLID